MTKIRPLVRKWNEFYCRLNSLIPARAPRARGFLLPTDFLLVLKKRSTANDLIGWLLASPASFGHSGPFFLVACRLHDCGCQFRGATEVSIYPAFQFRETIQYLVEILGDIAVFFKTFLFTIHHLVFLPDHRLYCCLFSGASMSTASPGRSRAFPALHHPLLDIEHHPP